MTAGITVAVLLGAAVLAFLAAPLLQKDAAEAERVAAEASEEMELQSQHDMVLGALKDLEDDWATEKVGDEDYRQLHDRLASKAVDIMKRLDRLNEKHERKVAATRKKRKPIPHPSAKR